MNMSITKCKNLVSTLVLAGVLFLGVASSALAQAFDGLNVSVDGNVATAEFSRPTPCTSYVLTWGDGAEDKYTSEAEMCIQVIDEVSLMHTYEAAGTYTVELKMGNASWSEEAVTTEPAEPFGLDDVDIITYVWIDPNEMMADEEFYIYTIRLESGEVVTVKAGGFTTTEYRNEQFEKAGYTGDVEALLAQAEQVVEEGDTTEDEVTPEQELVSLYQQLKGLLEEMLSRLQRLLSR